ncbi:MAG TPA: M1 family metallopeptidase [Candidatus Saccharimonadales bacterium]|jgi:aminopeptidase N|nr:M1 family metallopeptidase [Candidatus Saccharimonadales bacterium]
MSKKVPRLFQSFRPEHYQLELHPNRDTMHVSGTVVITGQKLGRPSQRLTFHQHGLTITSAQITHQSKKGVKEILPARINHHRTLDEVRLHADELLYAGTYEITMTFTGDITRPMEGIYPCYFKEGSVEKMLIATQFESHHARDAFPCIDEPEAKATFDLILVSPAGEAVVGNTPIKKQTKHEGKLVTTFETTPKMPTYLLAFIYGEMKHLEAKTKDGVLVRTYATPENAAFTQFALDVAVQCLEFYNEYFAIPYPLPKCDLIALPDFASGAMENWGCITFREVALFVDPANTSVGTKQYVAMVVAHELAHQWFGNLVTMRWWTDLWLNEGFANLMEYFTPNHLFPDWQLMMQYIVDEQQSGMKLDALANTHPVAVPIKHPDEIRTIFDAISYNKGGSCLLMLMQYLGEKDFRDGLRYYLKKHAYGNTDTTDLWEALEHVSGKPVRGFMDAWISQAGFPVVRADVATNSVTLVQEQFIINPLERKKHTGKTLWPIALHTNNALPDVFDQATATYPLPDPASFKLNIGQGSFCRIIYNPEHLAILAKRIKQNELGPLDRLGVLSDAFEAAKAGYQDTVAALELLAAYENEDNTVVWDIIAANLGGIRLVMNDEALRTAMKPFIRTLVAKQVKRLGWKQHAGESHFDTLLRPTIISMASLADEPSVVKEALRQFNEMTKPEDIVPDLRGVVYATAARHGDKTTYEKLLTMHNESTSSEERLTLCAALTDFKQPELYKRSLALIDTDAVRPQDAMYWIIYSMTNRFARAETWHWMKTHWGWLENTLGKDLSFFNMPVYVARTSSDADFLLDYKKFFESVMQPSLERSTKQGIEIIEWQSAWRKRDLKVIKAFFKA